MPQRKSRKSKVSPSSMAEVVYSHLLDFMLSSKLRPGEWVDRRQVALRLNTSLMPVAEAVQRLTSEGFLVAVPRRGTHVRVPTREEVRGQLLVREALECQAARLYSGKPINAQAERLLKLAEQTDTFRGEEGAAWQLDLSFHQELVAVAGCRELSDWFRRIMHWALFQHSALLTPYPFNHGDSHVRLMKELLVCNANDAEARVRTHIRTGKEYLLDLPEA